MAKKGSKKNPLILRLADESRVESITEICYKNGWQFILGIEPDQEEDLSDLERKLNPQTPNENPLELGTLKYLYSGYAGDPSHLLPDRLLMATRICCQLTGYRALFSGLIGILCFTCISKRKTIKTYQNNQIILGNRT